ncbi:uncharacterized protein M421DRAFT_64423 [Didymella exigua CBS 183.55]|uniref:Uncharacterized protein n=1 Tax=Didymella exigua CBS 183.55 TaxID=1150837 RepID=A0A6A5RQP2_9PLEO|nr:uncharacterized protein M421DRAFT_64423 [Didymella exigua CBS 183.55]KAF1927797.1 hypothetical protein M421DRAFT_64423 [Didymella exigua CBS 183.55]
MYNIYSNHTERIASVCKHSLHLSAPPHILQCPHCSISAAQEDLERARRKFEGEGGADASAYMRDRAWNIARLQYTAAKRRFKKITQRDWQRQERERLWDEGHQWYLSQHGHVASGLGTCSPCIICATLERRNQRYAKPVVSLTTAWWEREGALVEEVMVVPETPPRALAKTPRLAQAQPRASKRSYLAEFIKSWRSMRTVSDEQRRVWEDRLKLDRVIRQKYDLPDDYEIEAELFENPLPASHARHHHRQLQNGEHAAERRAKRLKRRAEGYRPCRSLLALSEILKDKEMDAAELEELRLEEEAVKLQRLVDVAATEVGFLYFVGEMGLLERWRAEFECSSVDLIQRRSENGVYIGYIEDEHVAAEEEKEM